MVKNKKTVADRIACGGVFADVKRILESGNELYIDCLRKSLAAYIDGIETDAKLENLKKRADRLEKIMRAENQSETIQRKARKKTESANPLKGGFFKRERFGERKAAEKNEP